MPRARFRVGSDQPPEETDGQDTGTRLAPPHRRPGTADAATGDLGTAATAVVTTLTTLETATQAVSGAPQREQLRSLLVTARTQATQIRDQGMIAADPHLALWSIAAPGRLRAVADRRARRSSGVAVLLPVLFTWLVLGIAEISYSTRVRDDPSAGEVSFFSDWLSAPWWRGPALLSVLIVVTVVGIIVDLRRSERDERAVQATDMLVQGWETSLHGPVETLRAAAALAGRTDRSAGELLAAAGEVRTAARALADLGPVVDNLRTGLDKLDTSVGSLAESTGRMGDQVGELGVVEERLRTAATDISARSEPIVSMVRDASAAADTARDAASSAERSLQVADDRLAVAGELVARSDGFRTSLEEARAPFVSATKGLDTSSGELRETAKKLGETVSELHRTMERVHWLSLVADGLRHADGDHRRPPAHDSEMTTRPARPS